eukprot:4374552-Amphidinium_carterae.2
MGLWTPRDDWQAAAGSPRLLPVILHRHVSFMHRSVVQHKRKSWSDPISCHQHNKITSVLPIHRRLSQQLGSWSTNSSLEMQFCLVVFICNYE